MNIEFLCMCMDICLSFLFFSDNETQPKAKLLLLVDSEVQAKKNQANASTMLTPSSIKFDPRTMSSSKLLQSSYFNMKVYTCGVCGRFFAYPSVLKTHLLTHNIEKVYECNICNKKFNQLSYFKEHEKKSHVH